MFKITSLLIAALCLSGCSAYKISENANDVDGIPFYTQSSILKQKTDYHRTWLNVKLDYVDLDSNRAEISGSQKSAVLIIEPKTFDGQILRSVFERTQSITTQSGELDFALFLSTFSTALQNACGSGENCLLKNSVVEHDAKVTTVNPTKLLQSRISNTTTWENRIDYSKPYYFNVRAPIFGTADTAITLSPEGTLSEASSNIDSSQLADLIPLKELLADKWGLDSFFDAGNEANAARQETPNLKSYSLTLSVEKDGYRYSLVKYHKNTGAAGDLNRAPLNFHPYQKAAITRTRFAIGSPQQADGSSENANAIKINGTITLPGSP